MNDTFYKMMDAVQQFHDKHDFENTGGHEPLYRMTLIMEEVGEICECLTKGKEKDALAEEHADLLILLLGNCIAMDIDIVDAFWKKHKRIMQRQAKFVNNRIRVTEGKYAHANKIGN